MMEHAEANRRAYRRAGAKLGFYIHLIAYIAVNLVLVVINLTTTPQLLWFLWPLLGWGLGLFAHGFAIFVGPKLMKRLVQQELEKNRQGQ